jgi:hypothetical protein
MDPHLRDEECETIPGYGKNTVVEAINLAHSSGFSNVAALIDRDWGKSRVEVCELAVKTDDYDMDATVFFAGSVCNRVVHAHCSRDQVRNFLSIHNMRSPVDAVTRMALPLGMLRKLSHDNGWGLRVADLPVDEIVAPDTITIDLDRMARKSFEMSKAPRISQSDLGVVVAQVRAKIEACRDVRSFCCGHDLNSCLAYLMRTQWSGNVGRRALERAMRAAYSCGEFSRASFFGGISAVLKVASADLFTCHDE